MVLYMRDMFWMLHVRVGEAWVAQWSERWTLGRTARVRVLDTHYVVALSKSLHSPCFVFSDKTLSRRSRLLQGLG